MSTHGQCLMSLTLVLLAVVGSSIVFAAEDTPQWRPVLEQQLLKEKGCAVAWLSNIRESERDGEIIVTALARCEDGWMYDVKRERPHLKFSFKKCPSTC